MGVAAVEEMTIEVNQLLLDVRWAGAELIDSEDIAIDRAGVDAGGVA